MQSVQTKSAAMTITVQFSTNAWWNDIPLLSDKYKFSDILEFVLMVPIKRRSTSTSTSPKIILNALLT